MKWRRLIVSYVDGRLDERNCAALEQHLELCAACRSEARQMEAVAGALKASAPCETDEPTIDLWPTISARIGSQPVTSPVRLGWAMASAFAGAAVVLAVVLVMPGGLLRQGVRDSAHQATSPAALPMMGLGTPSPGSPTAKGRPSAPLIRPGFARRDPGGSSGVGGRAMTTQLSAGRVSAPAEARTPRRSKLKEEVLSLKPVQTAMNELQSADRSMFTAPVNEMPEKKKAGESKDRKSEFAGEPAEKLLTSKADETPSKREASAVMSDTVVGESSGGSSVVLGVPGTGMSGSVVAPTTLAKAAPSSVGLPNQPVPAGRLVSEDSGQVRPENVAVEEETLRLQARELSGRFAQRPTLEEGRMLLALQMKMANKSELAKTADRLSALNPIDQLVWIEIGRAFERAEKRQQAIAAYRRAVTGSNKCASEDARARLSILKAQ